MMDGSCSDVNIHEGLAPSRMLSLIPSELPSLTSDINGIVFI